MCGSSDLSTPDRGEKEIKRAMVKMIVGAAAAAAVVLTLVFVFLSRHDAVPSGRVLLWMVGGAMVAVVLSWQKRHG